MNSSENATPGGTLEHIADEKPRHQPVASVVHTLILLAIILGFSFLTAHSQHTYALKHGRIPLYVETMIWEWLLVGFVIWGIRRRGVKLRDVIGGRWKSIGDFGRDVGIAIGYWLVAIVVLSVLGVILGLGNASAAAEAKRQLGFMVPRGRTELLIFMAVSATAGFCEEILFRGYLQRQFAALTRNGVAGMIMQAIVFGAAHGYEGGARMFIIAVYGAMFGALALWRRSLRPGMMAHGMHDAIEGFFLYLKF